MAVEGRGYKIRFGGASTYLFRMILFLAVVSGVVYLVREPLMVSIQANPYLNLSIIGVLIFGVLFTFGQVAGLWPKVGWVQRFRRGDSPRRVPSMLSPLATLLGESRDSISPVILRSILDSIGSRLDESRDISRYLVGLLVFMGLLGTFWGLLETINAVGDTIRSLSVGGGSTAQSFEELRTGLEAPLSGMGTAFSSSLVGLAGSLILGFLDLQMSQAQNRFYNDLEDWLSVMTVSDMGGLYGLD